MNSLCSNTYYHNPFAVSYNSNIQSITIATVRAPLQFKILTINDIKNGLNSTWAGANYDTLNSHSVADILKLNDGYSPMYNTNNSYQSGFIDLNPIRNVYISSSNMSSFKVLGPNNEICSIIKKVPVSADFNHIIFDQVVTANDFNDCSDQTFSTLEFRIHNSNYDLINLHGCHVSFSITFDIMNPNI